jgi:hypothetical protein
MLHLSSVDQPGRAVCLRPLSAAPRGRAQAFVQFAHAIGCAGAKKAIHGRMFAGATVQATYVSAEAFAAAAGPPSA